MPYPHIETLGIAERERDDRTRTERVLAYSGDTRRFYEFIIPFRNFMLHPDAYHILDAADSWRPLMRCEVPYDLLRTEEESPCPF
jgi:hypothetical protein